MSVTHEGVKNILYQEVENKKLFYHPVFQTELRRIHLECQRNFYYEMLEEVRTVAKNEVKSALLNTEVRNAYMKEQVRFCEEIHRESRLIIDEVVRDPKHLVIAEAHLNAIDLAGAEAITKIQSDYERKTKDLGKKLQELRNVRTIAENNASNADLLLGWNVLNTLGLIVVALIVKS
jgi:hypothetical protein